MDRHEFLNRRGNTVVIADDGVTVTIRVTRVGTADGPAVLSRVLDRQAVAAARTYLGTPLRAVVSATASGTPTADGGYCTTATRVYPRLGAVEFCTHILELLDAWFVDDSALDLVDHARDLLRHRIHGDADPHSTASGPRQR